MDFRPYCICIMAHVDPIDRLMRAALASDEEFVATLNDLMKNDLRISVRDLAEQSGISQSSLYKILHGKRSPNLSTLRDIVKALRKYYHIGEENFIGLIAARPVLESVEERLAEVDGHRMRVREYPVHTMEDAIAAGVRAEREGGDRDRLRPDRIEHHRAARPRAGSNDCPPRVGPAGDRTCRPEGVDLIDPHTNMSV